MSLQKNTYQQQSDLASYCRTGELNDNLDVRKDRVHHYHRLVNNIINDTLQSAFPLTVNLLAEKEWAKLVYEFFSDHNSQSPLAWQMPEEFYSFWKDKDHAILKTYPVLPDLLFFEWIEIELFMMEDKEFPPFQEKGNYLKDALTFNPEYKMIHLNYPVHLKNSKTITEDDKGDYYALVFREQESGKVQFMDISPFFTLLLENLIMGRRLETILEELKSNLNLNNTNEIFQNSILFIEKLKEKNFFLGFRKL